MSFAVMLQTVDRLVLASDSRAWDVARDVAVEDMVARKVDVDDHGYGFLMTGRLCRVTRGSRHPRSLATALEIARTAFLTVSIGAARAQGMESSQCAGPARILLFEGERNETVREKYTSAPGSGGHHRSGVEREQ